MRAYEPDAGGTEDADASRQKSIRVQQGNF